MSTAPVVRPGPFADRARIVHDVVARFDVPGTVHQDPVGAGRDATPR